MKIFRCVCDSAVFFDNTSCLNCKRELGFISALRIMSAIEPLPNDGQFKARAAEDANAVFRKCQNYAQHNVCNWLVAADDDSTFCVACRLNRTIPALDKPAHLEYWAHI